MSKFILWPTADTMATLPLIDSFSPVSEWEDGKPTGKQSRTDDGVPVWQATALLNSGWNPAPTLVTVRFASAEKPDFKPNPALLAALAGQQAKAARPADNPWGTTAKRAEGHA